MKEDAELICPISFYDPHGAWIKISKFVQDELPLRDVTWKSSLSSSYICIDRFPLRFLPSTANQFKDSDHPFRWFLAPYVNIYVLCAESMSIYKDKKAEVKKWIDTENASKSKSNWLILYIPLGSCSQDVYNKVYLRLCSDFCAEKPGDRTVMFLTTIETVPERTSSFSSRSRLPSVLQHSSHAVHEFLDRVKQGLVQSFLQRNALYEAEVRRLDSTRGSPQFNFRQLFLVKESCALMFQMMQLFDRALQQYEELETMLPYAPAHDLAKVPAWPLCSPTLLVRAPISTLGKNESSDGVNKQKVEVGPCSSSHSSRRNDAIKETEEGEGEEEGKAVELEDSGVALLEDKEQVREAFLNAWRNGDDVVLYSISRCRTRLLDHQMTRLELLRYLFARQLHFLLLHLGQPGQAAERSLVFMRSCTEELEQKVDRQYLIVTHEPDGSENIGFREEQSSGDRTQWEFRRAQVSVWALTAALKLLRVCKESSERLSEGPQDSTSSPSARTSRSNSIRTKEQEATIPTKPETNTEETADTNRLPPDAQRELAAALSELLQFSLEQLRRLSPEALRLPPRKAVSLAQQLTPWAQPLDRSSPTFGDSCPLPLTQDPGESLPTGEGKSITTSIQQSRLDNTQSSNNVSSPMEDLARQLQVEFLEIQRLGPSQLDKTLMTLALRVRSTCPYWAKLLCSSLSASSNHSIYSSRSYFGSQHSQEAVPWSFSASGSKSRVPLTALNSQLSKGQMEKGRALELTLAVLSYRIHWELQEMAGRYKGALAAQLRCGDILLGHGCLELSARVFECVLSCGSLTVALPLQTHCVVETISSVATQKENPAPLFDVLSWRNSVLHCGSLLDTTGTPGVVGRTTTTHSIVDWYQLRLWTLRKLLYISRRQEMPERYRRLASLLLEMHCGQTFSGGSDPEQKTEEAEQTQAMRFIQQQLIHLSGAASNVMDNAATEDQNQDITKYSETKTALSLPLNLFFGFSIQPMKGDSPASPGNPFVGVEEGYQMVGGDWFRSRQLRFWAGSTSKYHLALQLTSRLPDALAVDRVVVTYRRIRDVPLESFLGTSEPPSHDIIICSLTSITEKDNAETLVLEPGDQTLTLSWHAPSVGEYRLDSVLIVVGSLFFESRMLPFSSTNQEGPVDSPLPLFDPTNPVEMAEFCKTHSMIHVMSPSKCPFAPPLLSLWTAAPRVSPLDLGDNLRLGFSTNPNEVIESLEVIHSSSSWSPSDPDVGFSEAGVVFTHASPEAETGKESCFLPLSAADSVRRRKQLQRTSYSDADEEAAVAALEALRLLALSESTGDTYDGDENQSSVQCYLKLQPSSSWELTTQHRSPSAGVDRSTLDEHNQKSLDSNSILGLHLQGIPENQNISLNIPFSAHVTNGELSMVEDNRQWECIMHWVVKGKAVRHGCRIPFRILLSCPLRFRPSLLRLDMFTAPSLVSGGRWFAQLVLRNQSGLPIELVSYEVSGGRQGKRAVRLVEGPVEVRKREKGELGNEEERTAEEAVRLDVKEEFYAAFVFSLESSSNTADSVHRNEKEEIDKGNNQEQDILYTIQQRKEWEKHNIIHRTIDTPPEDRTLVRFFFRRATQNNSTIIPVIEKNYKDLTTALNATHFYADLYVPLSASHIWDEDAFYTNPVLTVRVEKDEATDSFGRLPVGTGRPTVLRYCLSGLPTRCEALSVCVRETEDWLVLGRRKRVLGVSGGAVEWEVCLVAVRLGVAPLPPIQVLEEGLVGEKGGLVFPNELQGIQSAVALPLGLPPSTLDPEHGTHYSLLIPTEE